MGEITNEVLAERMDNIKETLVNQFAENSSEHKKIQLAQEHTNGNVSALQKFKIQAQVVLSAISVLVLGIVIPLVVKYLSIVMFNK